MRLNKILFINTILLFVLVNTSYFWKWYLGVWILAIDLMFIAGYLFLLAGFLYQSYLAAKHRARGKFSLCRAAIILVLLIAIAIKPGGIIDYEKFEDRAVFIAVNNGVANCTSTLKLKQSGYFEISSICLGSIKVTEITR